MCQEGLSVYLLVVAGFGPVETRQDHVLCLVAHPDSFLQWDFGEDAGGLQDVPLRHRLRCAGEVPVGAVVGALVAALETHTVSSCPGPALSPGPEGPKLWPGRS